MLILCLLGVSIVVFLLALVWLLLPAFYGLPSVPTRPERIRKALQRVKLQPNENLYDLGAGDGRVVIMAAQVFGAQAVAIEVGPVQCGLIWLRAQLSGLADKIEVRLQDYLQADLRAADVVFVYATSREILKLAPLLESQLKPGARLISISADFAQWEPVDFDEHDLIFVYEMPPTPGSLATYLLKKDH